MKNKILGLKAIALVLLSSGCTHVIETFSESAHRSDLSAPTSISANSNDTTAVISQQHGMVITETSMSTKDASTTLPVNWRSDIKNVRLLLRMHL